MNKKYKIKTHKGFKKRFFLTKSKKVKFFSCGLRHGLSNKSRKHNRTLKKNKYLKTSSKSLIRKMIFFI